LIPISYARDFALVKIAPTKASISSGRPRAFTRAVKNAVTRYHGD
jgi:hypothetical protein